MKIDEVWLLKQLKETSDLEKGVGKLDNGTPVLEKPKKSPMRAARDSDRYRRKDTLCNKIQHSHYTRQLRHSGSECHLAPSGTLPSHV